MGRDRWGGDEGREHGGRTEVASLVARRGQGCGHALGFLVAGVHEQHRPFLYSWEAARPVLYFLCDSSLLAAGAHVRWPG